jgi:tetratricopeptide (TPR) repeat protein
MRPFSIPVPTFPWPPILCALGVFAALLAMFAGCSKQQPPDSHARMVALLEEVRLRADRDDIYFETESVRKAEHDLAALPNFGFYAERFDLHWNLGMGRLRLGNVEQAIEHFQSAEKLLPRVRQLLTPEQHELFLFDTAVGYLRLGETSNCVHCTHGESCILPIRGRGVHTDPTGSKKAIEYLSRLLEINPDHLGARWLLNIATMTVGGYPDQIPEEFRIPPSAFESEEDFPRFPDVADGLGLKIVSCAGGAVADDFDGDDQIDLLFSTWAPDGAIRYFRNLGNGRFEDRTQQAGLKGIVGGLNLVQADYDNDGDVDVLVLRGAWLAEKGKHPNSLLQNDGRGRFRDVTLEAGLGDSHFPTQTAAWGDFDLDGRLDLYIGNEQFPNQLFRNNGNGTFTDVAASAGVADDGFTKGVVWGDFNNDRWPDLYVSNLQGENRLYRNNGNGTFTDVAEELAVTRPINGFPAWFWDFNNDGRLDLMAWSYDVALKHVAADYLGLPREDEPDRLYQGDGKGGFLEVAAQQGLHRATLPMGANFGDLDNDGFPDIYLGTGYTDYFALVPNLMFHNRRGQGFADVTTAAGVGHLQKGHGVAFADFDNDGDLDVFAKMGGANPGDAFGNVLFQNPGFGNHWLGVKLIGQESNRSAIGARIKAEFDEAGKRRSVFRWVNSGGSFGANPLRQHLGVGRAEKIARLEIYWPTTDRTQEFLDVAVDQVVKITEGAASYRTILRRPATLARGE